jgi:sensor histidine kinase YesM
MILMLTSFSFEFIFGIMLFIFWACTYQIYWAIKGIREILKGDKSAISKLIAIALGTGTMILCYFGFNVGVALFKVLLLP